MKKVKKTPQNCKANCWYTKKCCENIEWSIGYLIGERVNLFVNACIHFVNNANKGNKQRKK